MRRDLVPPLGAKVRADVKVRSTAKYGTQYLARVRWTHPRTHRREECTATFASEAIR